MANMTKKQLVDENIRLRHNIDQLEQQLVKAKQWGENKAAEAAAATRDEPSLELVAFLQARGMPRMFQFGREVIPTLKQVQYWSQRVGATH